MHRKGGRFFFCSIFLILAVTVFSFFYISKNSKCSQVFADCEIKNRVIIKAENEFNVGVALKLKSLLDISNFDVVLIKNDEIFYGGEFCKNVNKQTYSKMINSLKESKNLGRLVFLNLTTCENVSGDCLNFSFNYGKKNKNSKVLADFLKSSFCDLLKFGEDKIKVGLVSKKFDDVLKMEVPSVCCSFGKNLAKEKVCKPNEKDLEKKLAFVTYVGLLKFYSNEN